MCGSDEAVGFIFLLVFFFGSDQVMHLVPEIRMNIQPPRFFICVYLSGGRIALASRQGVSLYVVRIPWAAIQLYMSQPRNFGIDIFACNFLRSEQVK